PEGEPEYDRADEYVLDDGLELPRARRGDHDATPARQHAEHGHGHLPTDQEQADPQRNASPDRDIVQVVPRAGDPVDRDEGGEEEQLVGNRIEQLAEVGDLVPGPGQVSVVDVADGRDEEDDERDELRPVARDEGQERDDRGEADPDQGDDVRDRPHAGGLPQGLDDALADRLEGIEHTLA